MLFVTFHFDEVQFHSFFFFFLPFIGLGWKAVTGESTLELGNLRSGPSFNALFFLEHPPNFWSLSCLICDVGDDI